MTTDDLTEALLVQLRRWPDDVQTASDWAASLPLASIPSPTKVKSMLDKLVSCGLVRKIQRSGPRGTIVAVFYGMAD